MTAKKITKQQSKLGSGYFYTNVIHKFFNWLSILSMCFQEQLSCKIIMHNKYNIKGFSLHVRQGSV